MVSEGVLHVVWAPVPAGDGRPDEQLAARRRMPERSAEPSHRNSDNDTRAESGRAEQILPVARSDGSIERGFLLRQGRSGDERQ